MTAVTKADFLAYRKPRACCRPPSGPWGATPRGCSSCLTTNCRPSSRRPTTTSRPYRSSSRRSSPTWATSSSSMGRISPSAKRFSSALWSSSFSTIWCLVFDSSHWKALLLLCLLMLSVLNDPTVVWFILTIHWSRVQIELQKNYCSSKMNHLISCLFLF